MDIFFSACVICVAMDATDEAKLGSFMVLRAAGVGACAPSMIDILSAICSNRVDSVFIARYST